MLAKMRAGTRVWSGRPSKPDVLHNAPYAVHVRYSLDHRPTHTLTSPMGVRTTTQEEPKSIMLLIAKETYQFGHSQEQFH